VFLLIALSLTDAATTSISPLSLHDALPISPQSALGCRPSSTRMANSRRESLCRSRRLVCKSPTSIRANQSRTVTRPSPLSCRSRSEEHTSELQSHLNLVCRLLLEKKKNKNN